MRLEEFVKANREEFDDIVPSPELWSRIERELPMQIDHQKKNERSFSLAFVVRVAASVIVVMGISFVIYLRSNNNKEVNYASINPVYAQQQIRYTALIENKRTALKNISHADPELYEEFSSETAQMDSVYKKLKRDLVTSPNPELVLRAMIRNLEVQTEVLNQQLAAIEQYNQMKKENESESI